MLGHELFSQAVGCHVWTGFLFKLMYAVYGLMIAKYGYIYIASYVLPAATSPSHQSKQKGE